MTEPCAEVLEREQTKLFVTDAELIRRIGVPEKDARAAIKELDRRSDTFPPKLKLWGDRRYWPAVVAYFNHQYGGSFAEETKGTGNGTSVHRERARPALALAQPEVGSNLARKAGLGWARVSPEK